MKVVKDWSVGNSSRYHTVGGGGGGEKTSSQRDLYSEAVDFSHKKISPWPSHPHCPQSLSMEQIRCSLKGTHSPFKKKDQVLLAIYLSSQNLYGEAGGTTNLLLLTSSHTQPTSCSFQGCPMPIQARLEMLQGVG